MNSIFSFLFFTYVFSFIFSCKQPEPETYLIPFGYKGKVNIIFNQVKGAPPKYDRGRRLYEIPSNGILLTMFKDEEGTIEHQYYYVDISGNRTNLPIIQDESDFKKNIGIFRDGTVGVYGNSDKSKSLSYQEFYVSDITELTIYFSPQYQKEFERKVMKLTGVKF